MSAPKLNLDESVDDGTYFDVSQEEEEPEESPRSKPQQELYYQFSPSAEDAILELPSVVSRSQAGNIEANRNFPEPPRGVGHNENDTPRPKAELPMATDDVVDNGRTLFKKEDVVTESLETDGLNDSPPVPHVLLRMPNTAFGISMGLAGNALMWKLAGDADFDFVGDWMDASLANTVMWFIASGVAGFIGFAYLYKIIFNYKMVLVEFKHPARVHFFNGPHLTLLMLSLGIPKEIEVPSLVLQILFAVGLAFQFGITQCVYEKWMFSAARNISQAKPQFLLSVIGWFLLTVLGQKADAAAVWGIDIPSFCFGTGFFMYVMVTVNVFNGLHRNANNKGSPALTLLIAPPSVAAIAADGFDGDTGEFNVVAQVVLGWAILLFLLLLRLGPRIAENPSEMGTYWAYVFPLAALSSACLKYAIASETVATEILATVATALATIALCTVFLRMAYHTSQCLLKKAQWGDPLLGIDSDITSNHGLQSPGGTASSNPTAEEQSMALDVQTLSCSVTCS